MLFSSNEIPYTYDVIVFDVDMKHLLNWSKQQVFSFSKSELSSFCPETDDNFHKKMFIKLIFSPWLSVTGWLDSYVSGPKAAIISIPNEVCREPWPKYAKHFW